MSILGRAECDFFGSSERLSLPRKRSNLSAMPLVELCKYVTPQCKLNPLLFNGHMQTVWTAYGPATDVAVYYSRHVFSAVDDNFPGSFAVDFCVPKHDHDGSPLPPRTTYMSKEQYDSTRSDDDVPMFVALHGLSGGSYELYVRSVLKPLLDVGWEGCVVNSRGCAKSKLTSGIMYNARATWDIRQTVLWLKERHPRRPLFGLGFSLGANILVNVSIL